MDISTGQQEGVCPQCGRTVPLSGAEEGKRPSQDADPRQASLDAHPPDEWPEETELELEPLPPELSPTARQPEEATPDEEPTDELEVPVRVLPEPRQWRRYLRDAWTYPLRGNAKWSLLLWTSGHLVLSACFGSLFWLGFGDSGASSLLAGFGLSLIGLAGLSGSLLMLSVLAWYVFHLIHQSAWEADSPPSLPRFHSLQESILRPAGHVLAILGAGSVPLWLAAVAWLIVPGMPSWWRAVMAVCALGSAVLLPINTLAVATSDHLRALDPRFTLPAIARLFRRYVVLWALCAPAAVLSCLAPLSFLGLRRWGFLLVPVGEVIWIYLLVVSARALGTFYYAYSEEMGWIKELKSEPRVPPRRLTR